MALLSVRKRMIRYWISIFSLPNVREGIAKYARVFTGEASRVTTGIRGEAVETYEAFQILAKYIRKEKLSREEKRHFKHQVVDLLKGMGVIVPPMLIPLPFVGTLLLVIMDHLLFSLNIRILPSSFYPESKKGIMTPEGVEEEFRKQLPERKREKAEKEQNSHMMHAVLKKVNWNRYLRVTGRYE